MKDNETVIGFRGLEVCSTQAPLQITHSALQIGIEAQEHNETTQLRRKGEGRIFLKPDNIETLHDGDLISFGSPEVSRSATDFDLGRSSESPQDFDRLALKVAIIYAPSCTKSFEVLTITILLDCHFSDTEVTSGWEESHPRAKARRWWYVTAAQFHEV